MPAIDQDTYKLTVTFDRSLTDDLEMARSKYPDDPVELALRKQLRDELQEACENGVAGQFNVESCQLPDGFKE